MDPYFVIPANAGMKKDVSGDRQSIHILLQVSLWVGVRGVT